MPRANPLQSALNAGEFSPRMEARVDFAKYANAAATVKNMIPLAQGGLSRRPGTRFVARTKDPDAKARLLRFECQRRSKNTPLAGVKIHHLMCSNTRCCGLSR